MSIVYLWKRTCHMGRLRIVLEMQSNSLCGHLNLITLNDKYYTYIQTRYCAVILSINQKRSLHTYALTVLVLLVPGLELREYFTPLLFEECAHFSLEK